MKKILFFIICFVLLVSCKQEYKGSLSVEYISNDELSNIDILHPYKNDIYIIYSYKDSIPYISSEDSLFRIRLSEDAFILYYNSSLFRNIAFIIFVEKGEYKVFTSNRILKADICHLNKYALLLRMEENVEPTLKRNNYFLLSNPILERLTNINILSEGAYWLPRDSINPELIRIIDLSIQDSIYNGKIYLKGVLNTKQFIDSIEIKKNQFIVSDSFEKLQWDNIKVIQNREINQKTVHREQ
jgi:hypothetical protein